MTKSDDKFEVPGIPDARAAGQSDAGRVRYLKQFVPPPDLAGMEMFVRHYGGPMLSPRAQNVLLLALLEGWAAALMYLDGLNTLEDIANAEEVKSEEVEAQPAGLDAAERASGEQEDKVTDGEDSGRRGTD